MEISLISATDTIEVRSPVLRPGLPLSTCKFVGDDDEQSFHLGCYIEGQLVGCASFYQESHHDIKNYQLQYRLRGMATLEKFQGLGIGKAMLEKAFSLIREKNGNALWCNARKSALGFYERLNFVVVGDEFDIEGVGAHFVMVKEVG